MIAFGSGLALTGFRMLVFSLYLSELLSVTSQSIETLRIWPGLLELLSFGFEM